jgi:acylphosphatase
MNMEKISAQVVIHGWVQGVYFRAFTRDQAKSLGLTGWVWNRRNGTVEAYFEGEKEKVDQMVAWCRRGSPSSRVEEVDVTFGPFSGDFDSFQIRYN